MTFMDEHQGDVRSARFVAGWGTWHKDAFISLIVNMVFLHHWWLHGIFITGRRLMDQCLGSMARNMVPLKD